MYVYVYMYYMLVRLSGCLNHIKGTIIIIIIIKTLVPSVCLFVCTSISVSTDPCPDPGPLRSNIASVQSQNIFWTGLVHVQHLL